MTIDEYIAPFPPDIREVLERVRSVIRQAAPDAAEAMAYGMPTFRLNGNLVHFAAFKRHIGFYPTPAGIDAFRDELSGYVTSKGAIQFPLDREIPLDLIGKITAFRAEENARKGTKGAGKER